MDIIDAFIVSIGLDPTEYERGADDVTRINAALKDKTVKDANEVEKVQSKAGTEYKKRQRESVEGNKKVSDSFNAVKRETLGMLAVLIGANSIKEFVTKSVTGFTTMQQAAQQAGLSVQDLAAFGSMIEANGGQADSARASISALAATLEAARTGLQPLSGPMLMGMNQIGAGLEDDPLQIYQKYAAWAEGKDPRLAAQTGRALGFDQAAIDLAIKGSAAVADAFAKARENLPTPADVEKVRDLQVAFADLSQDVKGFAFGMLTDAAPALRTMIELVDGLVESLKGFRNDKENNPTAYQQRVQAFADKGVMFPGLMAFFTGDPNAETPQAGGGNRPGVYPGGAGGGGGGNRARQAKAYFMSQGYTAAQASGMVAGMIAENDTMDPTRTNPTSGALGVGQWLGKRKSQLYSYARGQRLNPLAFDTQLAFMAWELRNDEARADRRIRSAQTPQSALSAYITEFMRPARGPETRGDLIRGARALRQVTVGQINIHTPSTNPREHAREVQRHLNTNPHVAGANSGVPN